MFIGLEFENVHVASNKPTTFVFAPRVKHLLYGVAQVMRIKTAPVQLEFGMLVGQLGKVQDVVH